jgi:hypothetical protein
LTPLAFPRLPFCGAELRHPSRVERVHDVSVPITMPDNFLVDQQTVAPAEDVG